jgi:hypothetical protein
MHLLARAHRILAHASGGHTALQELAVRAMVEGIAYGLIKSAPNSASGVDRLIH